MKKSKPFRETELALLKDPEKAREYLRISLEETRKDGNRAAFLRALRTVVDARGGIPEISNRLDKAPSTLYHAISENGNPGLDTIDLILKDIGLQLSVDLVEQR